MIAAFKFLHIGALLVWCASLVALPLVLIHYGDARRQERFTEFRLISHYGYIAVATPAAIVAIAAGTVLIFLRWVLEPWLFAKLVLVVGMVGVHVWIGGLILAAKSAPVPVARRAPWGLVTLLLALPLMAGVFALVLAKPDLSGLEAFAPGWLRQPVGWWQ